MRRYMFDGDGKIDKPAQAATKKRPLEPWIEQDPEEQDFMTLNHKNDLPNAIKRAQLATLNPRTSYKKFVPGENSKTDENYLDVKFSPNVVRLDISALKFPNLSFYDIPGVINVTEVEEKR